jgi:phosphate transport system substrate-binding protein
MSLTDDPAATLRRGPHAICTNVVDECPKAAAGEALDWYLGPGEYCPACGDVLTLSESSPTPLPPPMPTPPPSRDANAKLVAERLRSFGPAPWQRRHRRIWLGPVIGAICAVAAGAALCGYLIRKPAAGHAGRPVAIAVCAPSGIRQLAADLVSGYRANGGSGQQLSIGARAGCDVQFSTSSTPPAAVIARDAIVAIVNPLNPISRISEQQLRGIFSGAIRDWAVLGGPPAPIVAAMPDDTSDEADAIRQSLVSDVRIAREVDRPATSADVTREVSGADRRSRNTIGIVAFSASIPAKVIPLANLPAPSVLSIATRRYPYTMPIAVQAAGPTTDPAAAAFIDFVHSQKGAAIVARSGFVQNGGL